MSRSSVWIALLLAILLVGCSILPASPTPTASLTVKPTLHLTDTPAPTATFTLTPHPTLTPTLTETPFPEPEGCLKPPDVYTRVEVNGHTLNQRTYAMLQHAAELYGGVIEVDGNAITQGSYTGGEVLSFGTHDGGGAVDLSVVSRERFEVLYDEVEPLIRALRVAGFAAWYRDLGDLGEGSPIHIHAIAIGDAELSPAAAEQLTGTFGYFRGFNGIPTEDGIPIPDGHGGPVLCQWMLGMGYADLRVDP